MRCIQDDASRNALIALNAGQGVTDTHAVEAGVPDRFGRESSGIVGIGGVHVRVYTEAFAEA